MKSYDAYARKGKTTGYAGGYLLNLLFASTIGGFWTAKCGKIEEIIIKNNFAFIEYSTVQSSLNAIRNFNDYNFHGTKIVVEQAKTKKGKIGK